ncbi:hypothetical protein JCM10450v2_007748 [Rhodotorula kratochvilovae]
MSALYRRSSARAPLLKPATRLLAQPRAVLLALVLLLQPLFLWAYFAPPPSLRAAASHLPLHRRAAAPLDTDSEPFTPSSAPRAVHHTPALFDYTNHPVSPSRPPSTQFRPARAAAPPAVAVLTTTRDAEPAWLRDTAASLLGQSLSSLVWVVVDDGTAAPASRQALHELEKDERVVLLRHERAKGVGRGRNRALEYVKGLDEARRPRYVVSLEDDDLFELTALEKVVLMLESNPEWDLGGFHVVRFGEENSLGLSSGLHSGAKHLVSGNHVPDAAIVTTRALLQSGCRYEEDEAFLGAENWMLWLCLAKEGHWGGTVPEALFWHRVKPAAHKRRSTLATGSAATSLLIKEKYAALISSGAFPEIAPRPAEQLETVRWDFAVNNALLPASDGKALLLVLPTFAPSPAGHTALRQLELLAASGYRVTVAATHYRPADGLALRPEMLKWTHDVHVLPSYVRPSDAPGYLKNLIRSRGIKDVVFAESELLYQLLPALAEHLPDVRFVDYLHVDGAGDPSRFFLLSAISQRFLARSLASSPNVAAQLVAGGHSASSVGILPTGIDTRAFFPVSRKVRSFAKRKLLDTTDKTTVILVSSPLSSPHRAQLLPDIASALHAQGHTRFLLVFITSDTRGGDETVSLASLQEEIAARNVGRTVRVFAGGLDHPESYLAAADVFLRISASDERSTMLAEAMAMGLAVVSSATRGVEDLLAPAAGIVVDAPREDADTDAAAAFAEAVGALLSAPAQRAELGHQARAVAEEELDWRAAQMGLFEELERAKAAQGRKGAAEAARAKTQEVPVNPAAHYALQAVLMENHDEMDFAVSQNKLKAPPRRGIGRELQDRCGETTPDMATWIDSLERVDNCRKGSELLASRLQRSAVFQCIWDLTSNASTYAGWMYNGSCFERFENADKTWCRDWKHARPTVTLAEEA